jgi:pimeloyl-ACP methyl ester carboxylesterase
VLYWLYGYEQADDDRARQIAAHAAKHEYIVVSIGPVETTGEFPLYFTELVEHVDRTLRTSPTRERRAVAGAAMGGFLAVWTAGKFPDLVASAAALSPFAEVPVGPRGFPADTEIADRFNHDDVRIHQSDSVPQLLEFVSTAFPAAPPAAAPKAPAARQNFRHADPYPNFTVWGWEVASDRRQPGFTVLENVGIRGFRSSVREWVPGGAATPGVKLSISSPPRAYAPGSPQTVNYVRLRDRNVRRATQKADAQGRLTFDLDGDAYEVGVSAGPVLTAVGYDIAEAAWATAGKPVTLKVTFLNKGGARSVTTSFKWECPTPGVKIAEHSARVYGLAPGESAGVPVTFTIDRPATVRLVAVDGEIRLPLDVVVHPPAEPATLFQIADGVTVSAWRHGTQQAEMSFGEGNGDNHAAPGESFAVLFPDGESLRAAELFTAHPCVDNTIRASDSLGDHASIKYSLPSIRSDCEPGHVIRMLARIQVPGRPPIYRSIEFPVWYRP